PHRAPVHGAPDRPHHARHAVPPTHDGDRDRSRNRVPGHSSRRAFDGTVCCIDAHDGFPHVDFHELNVRRGSTARYDQADQIVPPSGPPRGARGASAGQAGCARTMSQYARIEAIFPSSSTWKMSTASRTIPASALPAWIRKTMAASAPQMTTSLTSKVMRSVSWWTVSQNAPRASGPECDGVPTGSSMTPSSAKASRNAARSLAVYAAT